MRKYEFLGIIDPTLTEDERTALLKSIVADLAEVGAKITLEDIWGVKNLAYKIHSSTEGFYVRYEMELPKGDFFSATKSLNLKKGLWRHMIVRLDA